MLINIFQQIQEPPTKLAETSKKSKTNIELCPRKKQSQKQIKKSQIWRITWVHVPQTFVLFLSVYFQLKWHKTIAASFLSCGLETYDESFCLGFDAMFHAVVLDIYEDIYRLTFESIKVAEDWISYSPNLYFMWNFWRMVSRLKNAPVACKPINIDRYRYRYQNIGGPLLNVKKNLSKLMDENLYISLQLWDFQLK